MHPVVEISKRAVEAYVRDGERLRPPAELPPELAAPAALFVSLKKGGQLRGCIGSVEPCCPTLAEEAIANAINSATRDPRFMPVEADELDELAYSVDVLAAPELIEGLHQLDPRRYGVVVERDYQRGLLLPDLDGV